jgi:hypothetical protein
MLLIRTRHLRQLALNFLDTRHPILDGTVHSLSGSSWVPNLPHFRRHDLLSESRGALRPSFPTADNTSGLVPTAYVTEPEYSGRSEPQYPLDCNMPRPCRSSGSTHTTRAVSTPLRIESFLCEIGHCRQAVMVNMESLTQHLQDAHGLRKGQGSICPWTGCTCAARARRATRECPSHSHPAHVQDLAAHVWERHLGFCFVCPGCDGVHWADRSSLKRHLSKCSGSTSARCGECYAPFESKFELVKHARHCWSVPVI